MTTPTVYPAGFAGDDTDYLKAKCDTSGAMRIVQGTVSVPAATATDSYIGLAPFRKGARLGYGSRVYTADLDTSTNVTLDVGYVYDDNVTYTNDPDAFVDGSGAAQSGGMMEMTALDGMTFVAEADGWFAVQNKAATTTTGNITFNLAIGYDG